MGIVVLKPHVSWHWDKRLFCHLFFISCQENKTIRRELSTSSESLDDSTIERYVRFIFFLLNKRCCFFCRLPACKMKRARNSFPSYSLPWLTTFLWFITLYMYKETKHTVRSQWKHVVPPEKSLVCVMGTSHALQTNHKKKLFIFSISLLVSV